jgi:cold-inducible RNA-binding protein
MFAFSVAAYFAELEISMSEGTRLYVGNLPFTVPNGERLREDHVRELFKDYGKIVDCYLMRERETNRLRGFGFVEFEDPQSARAAESSLDGHDFHGRTLFVNPANPRPKGDRRENGRALRE